MSDWIDEKAAQIKKNQKESAAELQRRVQSAEVIRSGGRDVLSALEKFVRADVEKWNAHFPGDESRTIDSVTKSLPSGFRVHKSHFPSATVDVEFDPESLSLRVRVAGRTSKDHQSHTSEHQIHLSVAADETIFLTPHTSGKRITLADASRLILEAILDQSLRF
jgi:hypothetical protein